MKTINKKTAVSVPPWRAFFTQYWLLKFLALIIAILLYVSVDHQVKKEFCIEQVPVKIDLSGSPVPLVPLEDISRSVMVKLQGNISRQKRIDASDINIVLNVKDAHVNGTVYSWIIDKENVRLPWGLQFISASPKRIIVQIDSMMHKTLPIVPVFQNRDKLPLNVELGKVSLVPAEIQISAPATVLKALKNVKTKPISLQDISQSFDCDVELEQQHFSKIELPKTKIMVQVEIIPAERTRVFKNLPVKILTAVAAKQPLACEIISSPNISATAVGPKNLIENLRREDLVPCIDISKFEKPGRYDIDVQCLTSMTSVRIKQIMPQRITVQLLKMNSKEK